MDEPGDLLGRHWLEAVGREGVRAGLEGVYAKARAEIEARGPSCWASGRCCNFERAGHRLYVTGLEAAYTVWAEEAAGERRGPRGVLSLPLIEAARRSGGCPFQEANLCGVHEIKPLGCRVYFCDRSAQAWQQELSERLLGEIRALHDAEAIEYRYGEWREMLERVVLARGAGR